MRCRVYAEIDSMHNCMHVGSENCLARNGIIVVRSVRWERYMSLIGVSGENRLFKFVSGETEIFKFVSEENRIFKFVSEETSFFCQHPQTPPETAWLLDILVFRRLNLWPSALLLWPVTLHLPWRFDQYHFSCDTINLDLILALFLQSTDHLYIFTAIYTASEPPIWLPQNHTDQETKSHRWISEHNKSAPQQQRTAHRHARSQP